jgi:hypothetical protein
MSYQSDFVADPVAFMSLHVLRCQFFDGGLKISQSRPTVVTVKEMAGSPPVINNRGAKVFYLTLDVAGKNLNEKTPIFWLGYEDNKSTRGMLTNHSPYMFTANMDGCTLGVGSQSGDGGCLVSHANLKSAGGGEGQRFGQQEQLRTEFADQSFRMLQPSSYMKTTDGTVRFKATNFGVNTNGTWKFYTHKWMLSGGKSGSYINGGCKAARPVPPVPPV